jgi:hypothetical protein
MKVSALIHSQEIDDVVSSNESLSATVDLAPQHKMTVELPPNIKLRLDVETTDTNLIFSEDVGRSSESCAGEMSGSESSPRGAVDGGGDKKRLSEIERLDGMLKSTDQRVSLSSSREEDLLSSLLCFWSLVEWYNTEAVYIYFSCYLSILLFFSKA